MASKSFGYGFFLGTVTIANGAAITSTGGLRQSSGSTPVAASDGIIDTSDYGLGGFEIPSSGWTSADITFTACNERAGTYAYVRDPDGVLVRCVVGTVVGWYPIPSYVFFAGRFIKFRSTNAASEADVNQSSGDTLNFIVRS